MSAFADFPRRYRFPPVSLSLSLPPSLILISTLTLTLLTDLGNEERGHISASRDRFACRIVLSCWTTNTSLTKSTCPEKLDCNAFAGTHLVTLHEA